MKLEAEDKKKRVVTGIYIRGACNAWLKKKKKVRTSNYNREVLIGNEFTPGTTEKSKQNMKIIC